MFDAVRFWFRRGIDGFRVDAIDCLFEDPQMRDNPTTGQTRADGMPEQQYLYTSALPENHEAFKQLRDIAKEYGAGRVLIGETYPPKVDDLLAYYGPQDDEFHMPFNFFLLTQSRLDAAAFRNVINNVEGVLGGRPTNYVLSNHDQERAFDKFGDGKHNDEIAKLLILMLMTLRGAPFFYYGEEIGMKTSPPERIEEVRDPIGKIFWPKEKGRDGERTPMQWTSGPNAGFSAGRNTWLPVPRDASKRNVATETTDRNSILNFFKRAVRMRRTFPALLYGKYQAIGNDPNVFVYRRDSEDRSMIVALNMSGAAQTVDLGSAARLKVILSNIPSRVLGSVGTHLQLQPFEAVALED